ncbi:metallophosphoesterase [Candidatus Woesearchaeota archaeon]|nr:metallophosphoesterase [Candidatus Woesearchaeota archaeon]
MSVFAFNGNTIISRPTETSVTLNILSYTTQSCDVDYGTQSGNYTDQIPVNLTADETQNVVLDNLNANTQYYLRVCSGNEETFHTPRPAGSSYIFTMSSDSHLGAAARNDPEIYNQTLQNINADEPDFHLALGDEFNVDNVQEPITYAKVETRYINQRPYLSQIGAPFYFVIGNHESEAGWLLDETEDNMAVYSALARKDYYPNPVPNGFYTGNNVSEDYVGLRENYYSWEWGNALFVVLDPYWYTTTAPVSDMWVSTIGDDQYTWFKNTLEQSDADFKFVFMHHIHGKARGGIEVADYYEFGGLGDGDEWEFDTERPTWDAPLRDLMEDNNVDIFFQGHDHVFVKQESNGLAYQTMPMAADPNYGEGYAENYTYGDLINNSGHLRVHVSPSNVTVQYVRAYVGGVGTNGEIAYEYTIEVNTACNDGVDNDGDNLTDYPYDPGCSSANDTSELGTNECDDGIDNDGDGNIDTADGGCLNASGTDETNCGDGVCEGGETSGTCPADCGGTVEVFFDGFESGTLSTWSVYGDGDPWTTSVNYVFEGNYSARAKTTGAGLDSFMEHAINLSGYSSATFDYRRQLLNLDGPDDFEVQYYNSSWTSVEHLGTESANDASHQYRSFSIPTTATAIRFKCECDKLNERCFVENVNVTAEY